MVIISAVTFGLLSVSCLLKRLRTAEVLLLIPFAIGSVTLPLFGIVSFTQLREGHLVLALFLAFEWVLLTVVDLALDDRPKRHFQPHNKNIFFDSQGQALRWCSLVIIVILSIYAVNVSSHISGSPSLSNYFIQKRTQAHAGVGLDVTNPLVYRAINFAMALLLLLASWKFFARKNYKPNGRTIFSLLLIVGGFTSILEGNRSTLIVTLISLLSFIYIRNLVKAKFLVIWIALFVFLFVLSMQALRLGGDYSVTGLKIGLSWFAIYAFGSVSSFADFFDANISTFWYAFDVGAQKFGADFASIVGARKFFIIDYVRIGDLSTNVYGGYSVLLDYLGWWAPIFLMLKTVFFYFVKLTSRRSFTINACYMALLSSYPLTIFHEFMLTTLYYCLNILFLATAIWLFCQIKKSLRTKVSVVSGISLALR